MTTSDELTVVTSIMLPIVVADEKREMEPSLWIQVSPRTERDFIVASG
ncbi:hypothetical protein FM106_14575 [Brachybacterium faecium]|nr:hypothetical protein FM106_14575 [Brachybacterium faecium]